MLASVAFALYLFSPLSAATAAALVPLLHFQLAPARLLIRDACVGGAYSLFVLAALDGGSSGPVAVAAHPACACIAAGCDPCVGRHVCVDDTLALVILAALGFDGSGMNCGGADDGAVNTSTLPGSDALHSRYPPAALRASEKRLRNTDFMVEYRLLDHYHIQHGEDRVYDGLSHVGFFECHYMGSSVQQIYLRACGD